MTTPPPVEIELKLALPPQQAAAFLGRMARRRTTPEQRTLVTRYFDTPDFALSDEGVALRLRRAGRRWLQTLKTEGARRGGLSQRAEYETQAARDGLDWERFPAEARALVPDAVRARLVPVFDTHFKRTAWLLKRRGGARIEVALDIGEVRAGENSQPICEIELELKAGRPDALFALALEWAGQFDCLPLDASKAERGVRLAHGEEAAPMKSVPVVLDGGMSVEESFVAVCQACLAQFQANLPGVLSPLPNPSPEAGEGANAGPAAINDDIEYVHQARVALRRLRAALRLYRRVCVLPDALGDGLRALAAALGPARDWDVLCCETLPAIAPHYPDPAAWQSGMHAVEARRAEVRAAMQAALREVRPGAWLLTLQRWLLQHGWRATAKAQRFVQMSPVDRWARKALRKGHRAIVRGAREFAQLQPAQRHALRIAIKRQRYAAEFFQALYAGHPGGHPRRQARYLAVLRDAQDSLGRTNDARVAWDLLTSEEVDAGPMASFVLGWLAAQQADAEDGDSAGLLRAFLKLKRYW